MADKTTNIVGYFNGNGFPIQLNISPLGLSFTLPPGNYITVKDVDGKKVKTNDPFLSDYVGKNRLSVEKSTSPVPLVLLSSRNDRGQVRTVATGQPIREGDKLVTPDLPPPSEQIGSNNPIRAYPGAEGIKAAQQAGLIPKTFIRKETAGLKETDGAPRRGEEIPEMVYQDADVRTPIPISKEITLKSVNLTVPPSSERVPVPVVEGRVKPVQLPEVKFPTLSTIDSLATSSSSDDDAAVEETKGHTVPGGPRFICDVCSPPKPFGFRSQLISHVKKSHPAQLEQVVDRYPEKSGS